MGMKTHEILLSLYKRSGFESYKDLAHEMGFKHASSIQRYFKDGGRRKKYLPIDLVEKFALAFNGLGEPPISMAEVWILAGPGNIGKQETSGLRDKPQEYDYSHAMNADEEEASFMIDHFARFKKLSPEAQMKVSAKLGDIYGIKKRTSDADHLRNSNAQSKKNDGRGR